MENPDQPKRPMTLTEKAAFMEDRDDNKNFYDQFDRNSILYHEGFNVPVPIGENWDVKRVPESMPNMYPEGFDPNAPVAKVIPFYLF
jgi:hypothetical protein